MRARMLSLSIVVAVTIDWLIPRLAPGDPVRSMVSRMSLQPGESEQMMGYWTNFARSGDPNGPGLPSWPRYTAKDGHPVLHLAETTKSAPDTQRSRYQAIDTFTDTLRRK